MLAARLQEWVERHSPASARPAACVAAGDANLEDVSLKVTDPPLFLPDDGISLYPGEMRAKLTTYADGQRLVVYPVRNAHKPRTKPCSRAAAERLRCNIARARSTVRHKARSLEVAYLWTFTKRGKFESLDHLWAVWREFERLARKRLGKFDYIAVPELHADGVTWHLHVAIPNYLMVENIRPWWYLALGGWDGKSENTPGSVNAKYFRGGSTKRIWRYISKYVGKDIGAAGLGRRSFSSSKGIRPRAETRYYSWVPGLGVGEALRYFRRELAAPGDGYYSIRSMEGGVTVGWFETKN